MLSFAAAILKLGRFIYRIMSRLLYGTAPGRSGRLFMITAAVKR